jgi:hypothetical protein
MKDERMVFLSVGCSVEKSENELSEPKKAGRKNCELLEVWTMDGRSDRAMQRTALQKATMRKMLLELQWDEQKEKRLVVLSVDRLESQLVILSEGDCWY